MKDPYQVLNIAPTASDDEVKHAYRELARKYHPDNYHDNPLADLAQEKMKEINEAYDQIQKQRKSGGASRSESRAGQSYAGQTYGGQSYAGQGYARQSGYAGGGALGQARMAINRGDIAGAEALLARERNRGAEWNFLTGVVCSYRGRLDEARRYIEIAVRMDPDNAEYRQALSRFSHQGYRPAGFRSGGTLSFNTSCMQYCAAMAVCSMCFPGGFYCMPCYL